MTIDESPLDGTVYGERCTVVDVSGPGPGSRRVCVAGPLDDEDLPDAAYTVHERVNRALAADGLAPVEETRVVPSSSTGTRESLHHRAVEAVLAGAGPEGSSGGFSAFTGTA